MTDGLFLFPQPSDIKMLKGSLNVNGGLCLKNCVLPETSVNFAIGEYLSEYGVITEFRTDNSLPEEAYVLCVGENVVQITQNSEAGAFYALITLSQLIKLCGVNLPCSSITDAPSFHNRGVMIDISRNKIPSLDTLKNTVDFLARLKVNQFQLYIEGQSFYYPSFSEFYDAETDVLTPADVSELDVYCKARFIDFVPNQNVFGHMSEWLAHKEFLPLAECPDGFDLYGVKTPPSTLNPFMSESLDFVKKQLADLLPLFSSSKVNVGGDEPFELGEGASKEEVNRCGKGKVYLDFMGKVFTEAKRYGKQPMMWGDVFKERYDECKPALGKDITVLEWGYDAQSFTDEICALYENAGVDYYLCPGTSLWNTVAGKTDNMLENIRSAARLGKKHGASGILLVDWGDGGTCQPYVSTLLPYALGAAYSWNAGCEHEKTAVDYLDKFVFGGCEIGQVLFDLGNYENALSKPDFNATKIFKALYVQQTDCLNVTEGNFEPLFYNRDFEYLAESEYNLVFVYISEIQKRISDLNPVDEVTKLYKRELEWAAGYLSHGCKLGALCANKRQFLKSEIIALYDNIKYLNKEYEDIWKLRNKRTGLKQSMMRMNALRRKYKAIIGDD